MTLYRGYLLPDGGFLAVMRPVNGENRSEMYRYSTKGDVLWSWKGKISRVTLIGDRIYLSANSAGGDDAALPDAGGAAAVFCGNAQ